jgi:hypothetical protein
MSLIPRGEGLPGICIVSAPRWRNPRGLSTRGWHRLWVVRGG